MWLLLLFWWPGCGDGGVGVGIGRTDSRHCNYKSGLYSKHLKQLILASKLLRSLWLSIDTRYDLTAMFQGDLSNADSENTHYAKISSVNLTGCIQRSEL